MKYEDGNNSTLKMFIMKWNDTMYAYLHTYIQYLVWKLADIQYILVYSLTSINSRSNKISEIAEEWSKGKCIIHGVE